VYEERCVTVSKILSYQTYFQENQNEAISKDGNVVEAAEIGNLNKDPFVTGLKHLVACIHPNPDNKELLVADRHKTHKKFCSLGMVDLDGVMLLHLPSHTTDLLSSVLDPIKNTTNNQSRDS
jgi:hypothetical protein